MDPQLSIYHDGAAALGFGPVAVVYDVVSKPTIRPHKATPLDKRKYKANGELYANQREFDETPDEYRDRLEADVSANPDDYFRRGEVVRLKAEMDEARADNWYTAKRIKDSQRDGYHPRNPDACERYGSLCEFFGVCAGIERLDDPARFVKLEHVHPELSADAA